MIHITNVILLWREVWIGTIANNYTKWILCGLYFPLNAQHLELGMLTDFTQIDFSDSFLGLYVAIRGSYNTQFTDFIHNTHTTPRNQQTLPCELISSTFHHNNLPYCAHCVESSPFRP